MEWSWIDASGIIASVGAALAVIYKEMQTISEVKTLGKRVDKLEVKVDKILFLLSRKYEHRKK